MVRTISFTVTQRAGTQVANGEVTIKIATHAAVAVKNKIPATDQSGPAPTAYSSAQADADNKPDKKITQAINGRHFGNSNLGIVQFNCCCKCRQFALRP